MNLDLTRCNCNGAGFCQIYNKEMDAAGVNWCKRTSKEKRENYKEINNPQEEKKIQQPLSNYVNPVNFYDKLPKQKSDIAVCTIPANDIAMEQLNITRKSIKSYAKKCGADYIELSGDQCTEFPMYNKYRLHQVTSKYEKTLYLDCDVIINDIAPNIFLCTSDDKISALDEKEAIFLSGNDDHYLRWTRNEVKKTREELIKQFNLNLRIENIERYLNLGVMVIPKVCADMYRFPDKPVPKYWVFDQDYFVLSNEMKNIEPLDERYNWIILRNDFWENIDKKYFFHICTIGNQEYRESIMNNIVAKDYTFMDFPKNSVWKNKYRKLLSYKHVKESVKAKKSNAIFCIATSKYSEYKAILYPSLKNYAEKCDADLHFITNETQDWWGFERFRLHNLSKPYKRVMLIEPDCFLRKNTPNLFDLVPENQIGIFNDYHVIDHDHEWFSILRENLNKTLKIEKSITKKMVNNCSYYNGGVIICSSEHNDIWKPPQLPIEPGHVVDQFIVELNIFTNNYEIFELDKKFNCQSWFPSFELDKKESYIIHFSNSQNKKEALLKEIRDDNE